MISHYLVNITFVCVIKVNDSDVCKEDLSAAADCEILHIFFYDFIDRHLRRRRRHHPNEFFFHISYTMDVPDALLSVL